MARRLRLLNYDKEININIDEKLDKSQQLFFAATYRQLVIASPSLLTIYDLSSILLNEEFQNKYDVITPLNEILALTSSIDRVIYVYQSKENNDVLKICSLFNEEYSFEIKSFDVKEKIHVCLLDDGTIYIGYLNKIYSIQTNQSWSLESKIQKLQSGKEHILVLLEDGRLFTWGNGLHGALGLGDLEPCTEPTCIEVLGNDVKDIAAGGWHSLALLSDGSVMSWGWNNDGALGLEKTEDGDDISGVFSDPTLVTCLPLDIDCKHISAGARHSVFIGTNDHVWLCGSNKHGQLGRSSSFSLEKETFIYCLSWFTLFVSY